ncbi:ribonuclease domain-containing protein [Paenibacillus radicis (ex Gao et al. 2016)]|uniref:Ribonuclease n=1 Tax=Paenibacillus radicis (ex Gao et al. 2016) TaxID=1737354 RepID=A0A917H2H3_9BACL|nr:ribonuclease domain-containing protein [Paenibacillus radicis (ex Gao et al. 2016)]GGG65443.1 ribonuclease Ba [Paenibacillus radicis (ex Gao et al. 2016)]
MFGAIGMKRMGSWTRSLLAAMIMMAVIVLTSCGNLSLNDINSPSNSTEAGQKQQQQQQSQSQAPLTSFKAVSDYIRQHHKLPDNFITKKEAEQLGWVASKGNLNQVAPGKSIGGDRFGNREGLLPKEKNRIWYEADINYKKGTRGADRILYSNDGLIYMTTDHYKSFTDITKKGSLRE